MDGKWLGSYAQWRACRRRGRPLFPGPISLLRWWKDKARTNRYAFGSDTLKLTTRSQARDSRTCPRMRSSVHGSLIIESVSEECDSCGNKCLGEMAECAKLCIDCADLCWDCAAFISRDSRFIAELCQVCATICDVCAVECEKHQNEHCRRCAEACRRCAEECRKMATSAGPREQLGAARR